jgi:hypothetical protein
MATTGVTFHRRDERIAAEGAASSRGEGHCWRQGRHGVRSAYAFVGPTAPLPAPGGWEMPDQVGHDGFYRLPVGAGNDGEMALQQDKYYVVFDLD